MAGVTMEMLTKHVELSVAHGGPVPSETNLSKALAYLNERGITLGKDDPEANVYYFMEFEYTFKVGHTHEIGGEAWQGSLRSRTSRCRQVATTRADAFHKDLRIHNRIEPDSHKLRCSARIRIRTRIALTRKFMRACPQVRS